MARQTQANPANRAPDTYKHLDTTLVTDEKGRNHKQLANGKTSGFNATLTVADMVIYGLIFMVPIAPFSIYGNVFFASDGMPALAYLVAMVGMIFTALSFGVMVPLFPSSGSIYTYATHGMGKAFGFVTGWLMILQYVITPDLMYIMAAEGLKQYLPAIPSWVWCIVFLAFVTVVTTRGIGATMVVDRIALVGELIVLFMFFGFGISYVLGHPEGSAFTLTAIVDAPKLNVGALFSAISLCALSYVGFGSVATLTEESKAGPKGPGRAMIIIVLVLGTLFFAMCYIATCVDPTGSLMKADPDNGFYVLAALVGGQWFGVVCVVAIALALGIFTGLAAQTSISRILYVMGQSGALPTWLGQLDEKNRQPVHATLFVSAVSLVMLVPLLFMSMDTVVKVSNFGALSTYCILNVCVLAICWFGAKKKTRPIRYLVFPVLGAVITFAILCSLGIVPIVVGIIWAALGIGYYLFRTRVQHKTIDMS